MTPRGLSKQQAAEYCGCATLEAFDAWVRKGIIPGAIPGTHRWDRKAIDDALDRASGLTTPSDHLTPYQRWKADERSKGKAA
jgi:hypothetical protein